MTAGEISYHIAILPLGEIETVVTLSMFEDGIKVICSAYLCGYVTMANKIRFHSVY